MQYQLEHGDCLEVLRTLADSSVDAIITDPPYGLSFMGKKWDYDVPGVKIWAECLRVLKPGGHLLAFAGTRTQHRMAVRIEDAGFEIRDMIAWVYGSGFPKSLDVSKAIDKVRDDSADIERVRKWLEVRRQKSGMTRKAVNEAMGLAGNGGGLMSAWTTNQTTKAVPQWDQWLQLKAMLQFGDDMDDEVWRLNGRKGSPGEAWQTAEVLAVDARKNEASGIVSAGRDERVIVERQIKAANSDVARQWQGWGTALKPALEPITVARKPLLAGTVAANVLEYGTGALNINACRVPTDERLQGSGALNAWRTAEGRKDAPQHGGNLNDGLGRWPANLLHDGSDEVAALFPHSTSGAMKSSTQRAAQDEPGSVCYGTRGGAVSSVDVPASSGSTARFFYCAKASRSDRNAGLATGSIPAVGTGATMRERENADWPARNGNHHPTVKPTDLMAYLCRLVTPPGGLVLDPFMGSGSTGKACMREGFRFLGIEREAEYLAIARARIEHEARRHGALSAEPLPPETITAAPAPPARHAQRPEPEPAQRGLF